MKTLEDMRSIGYVGGQQAAIRATVFTSLRRCVLGRMNVLGTLNVLQQKMRSDYLLSNDNGILFIY